MEAGDHNQDFAMSFYSDHIFPPLLDWATRPFHRDRERLIEGARGRVLEIGVGNGANLPLYGAGASEIHGLEPDTALLARARRQVHECAEPQRFQLIAGSAHELPYPDDCFDTVVTCLVMCTIPDPRRAAREMRRVLASDGRLLILEHVASERPSAQRWQRRLTPLWKHLACGCHLDRSTAVILADAGFDMTATRSYHHPRIPAFIDQILEGTATLRAPAGGG